MDELDEMDIGRWLRMLQARSVVDTERKRAAWLRGVLKSESISPNEWRAIQRHDETVSDG